MAPWIVSAIFGTLPSVWESNPRSYEDLKTVDTSILLKQIDDVLSQATKVLKPHKYVLPDVEYGVLQAQNRTYRLVLTDDIGKFEQASTEAEKAECHARATRLLNTVKDYRSAVVEASRRATASDVPNFPDEEPETVDPPNLSDTPERSAVSTPTPTPPQVSIPPSIPACASPFRPPSPSKISRITILPNNVGLMGRLRTANSVLSQVSQNSAPAVEPEFIEGNGLGFGVVHIPRDLSRKLYERVVFIKVNDIQLRIPHLKLLVLEPDEVVVNDKTLAEAALLVQDFLLHPEKYQKPIDELEMEID
ncbi:hypothetical protein FRC07_014636 [Ceratobasidium sp. 392]|nr:hypothetical protein FRC07_014636 [Ceratobasidium sp. 392]